MTRTSGAVYVRTFVAVLSVVALAAPVGCGGSEEPATTNATPSATKAASEAAPDVLVGTWTRRLRRSATSQQQAGTYTMRVHPDGQFEMYLPGSSPAQDCVTQAACEQYQVSASGGNLIVGDTADCPAPAEYSYEITDDMLTTAHVQEDCVGRSDRPRWFHRAIWRRVK